MTHNYSTVTSALLCMPYLSDFFFKQCRYTENGPLFSQVEVAKCSEFTFGKVILKRKAFLWKHTLIGHRSISLQSVCTKAKLSSTITAGHNCVQELHSLVINLLGWLTSL